MGKILYHLSPDGVARRCSKPENCRYGKNHYGSKEEAYSSQERSSWGFKPGDVAPSNFLKAMVERPGPPRFQGTLQELRALVLKNFPKAFPGTGSREGDVLIVPLPPERFFSTVVKVTPENAAQVVTLMEARRPQEAPVLKRVLPSRERYPAKWAGVVLYRADILEEDQDRSSSAEWEMVSILTSPIDGPLPMTPETMARNALHQEGGTFREYSSREWAEAVDFWSNHVSLGEPKEEPR